MVAKVKRKVAGKLTGKAAQRVAIARDVIARVRSGQLEARNMGYCIAQGVEPHGDAKEALAGATCQVCALGAVFVATVLKRNCIGLEDVHWHGCDAPYFSADNDRMVEYLEQVFTRDQLASIEAAFEGRVHIDSRRPFSYERRKAFELYAAGATAVSGLLAIMRNIIRNGGTFVMPKQIVAEAKRQIAASAE